MSISRPLALREAEDMNTSNETVTAAPTATTTLALVHPLRAARAIDRDDALRKIRAARRHLAAGSRGERFAYLKRMHD